MLSTRFKIDIVGSDCASLPTYMDNKSEQLVACGAQRNTK
jgi:hypothetical protein